MSAVRTGRVLEVQELDVVLGGKQILSDITFSLGGGVTGLLGPNGAGKTTLLRTCVGLVKPHRGHALLRSHPYNRISNPSSWIGVCLGVEDFHPQRSARNHLRVQADALGINISRVDEVLDEVGLNAASRKRVGRYSLGMRQRLALAQALLCKPSLLFLDEPTTGLDIEGVIWLRSLLQSLSSQGCTIVFSSHQLAEVRNVSDRVLFMNGGRIRADSTLSEMAKSIPPTVEVRTLHGEAVYRACVKQGLSARYDPLRQLVVCVGSRPEQVKAFLTANALQFDLVREGEPDWEQTYMSLVQEASN